MGILTIQIISLPAITDYVSWLAAYNLTGVNAFTFTTLNSNGINNFASYALGIDPVRGISPAQPEPRPIPILVDGKLALHFLFPIGGRPDLRFTVEFTNNLNAEFWDIIATKEGSADWQGVAQIQTNPTLGLFNWTSVIAPNVNGVGFIRLRTELITAEATGFGIWPGIVGANQHIREISDANNDTIRNFVAYALGASSATSDFFVENTLPSFHREQNVLYYRTTLRDGTKPDAVYIIEGSNDLIRWMELGLWTTEIPWTGTFPTQMTSYPDGSETIDVMINPILQTPQFFRLVVKRR
jgi:hypothetical protein